MGTDIYGWVEIYNEEDNLWDGIITASTLMDRDYAIFGILFGSRCQSDNSSIAPKRGIPENVSPHLEAELKTWQKIVSPSWITWAEIRAVDWEALEHQVWPEWKLLFDLMSLIAQRYGAENTRLVVWFDQ